jgi:hypothetical protein
MISSSKQAGFSQGVHRTAQGKRVGGVLKYIYASVGPKTASVGQDGFAILWLISQLHASRGTTYSKQAGFSQGAHRTAQGKRVEGVLKYMFASVSPERPVLARMGLPASG